MTTMLTKLLALIGVIAIVGMVGVTAVTANGLESVGSLSDDVITDQAAGECDGKEQKMQQQNHTRDRLMDGSCEQKQELSGEGDMVQNQYKWSYQNQNANQNGDCDEVEALGGDQVQNQHEHTWQHDWSHQYGDCQVPE